MGAVMIIFNMVCMYVCMYMYSLCDKCVEKEFVSYDFQIGVAGLTMLLVAANPTTAALGLFNIGR